MRGMNKEWKKESLRGCACKRRVECNRGKTREKSKFLCKIKRYEECLTFKAAYPCTHLQGVLFEL